MQCTNGDRYGGRPARAVLALGTSEALARAFAQQGSVNDGIGAPLVAKERGGAETSSSALGEPRRWSEAKANGTRMLAKFVDDNFHDGNFSAPRAPASERAQHEAEPGYDPELGAAPEFTVGLRWAGATNVCDPAGSHLRQGGAVRAVSRPPPVVTAFHCECTGDSPLRQVAHCRW